MDKDFVPYKESLELKQLGFDEPCLAVHYEHTFYLYTKSKGIKNSNKISQEWICTAPIFSQSFRWFREKHNLHPHFFLQPDSTYVWCIRWFQGGRQKDVPYESSNTPEEAELACLRKLIEIVKQKQKNKNS